MALHVIADASNKKLHLFNGTCGSEFAYTRWVPLNFMSKIPIFYLYYKFLFVPPVAPLAGLKGIKAVDCRFFELATSIRRPSCYVGILNFRPSRSHQSPNTKTSAFLLIISNCNISLATFSHFHTRK